MRNRVKRPGFLFLFMFVALLGMTVLQACGGSSPSSSNGSGPVTITVA